jgi:hypothetical protein
MHFVFTSQEISLGSYCYTVNLTGDKVWIGNCNSWILTIVTTINYPSLNQLHAPKIIVTKAHIKSSFLLLGIGFQRQTFFLFCVPELSATSYTSFSLLTSETLNWQLNCCRPSPAQRCLLPSPTGCLIIFYCLMDMRAVRFLPVTDPTELLILNFNSGTDRTVNISSIIACSFVTG